MVLSFFRLLFLIPKFLWNLAGIKRTIRRSKRKFKRALVRNGIPNELAEELANEYALVDEIISLKTLAKFSKYSSFKRA
ncbi:hypothetical protein [Thermococcus paralvinellae]|uniref:Uncharacterized protein n=1 Tax=Thermococcus paralvinellae TaxID=582419 RepID=W0I6S2_9EURY|nr:hypothetical protein [Thermococcus paralvinellae]AHF80098.1 Hypothetical protein TES1_0712 [Thermococcus paralvinellae]